MQDAGSQADAGGNPAPLTQIERNYDNIRDGWQPQRPSRGTITGGLVLE
jgi:hypothetical protein